MNVNPVLVRKEMRKLRACGLIESKEGKTGGYSLALPPQKISLADVYKAVKLPPALGQAKNKPNPACPVGKQIGAHLDHLADEVEAAIIKKLSTITIFDFVNQFD